MDPVRRSSQALAESRGRVDTAVLRHRAEPTGENRQALFAAMEQHNDVFMREQTIEFIRRTKESRA